MKKTQQTMVLLCTLFSTALLLAGCGAGSKSSVTVHEETAAAMAADYNLADTGRSLNTAETAAEMAAGGSEIAMEGAPLSQVSPQTGRKLIKHIRMDLESTDFNGLVAGITDKVNQLEGYIESSNVSGNSITGSTNYRHAYITVRIPSNQLDAFVTAVSEQGNVTSKSENTTDVTLQYTDMESRKKSLLVEQERLWELLEKADSLEGIIALETRLSEIRYQLESYEAQLRLYDNQVDYSTVELSLNEVKVFTPTSPDSIVTRIQKGFMQNLNHLADFFINLFIFLAAYSPIILLIAVFVITMWILIRKIVKRKTISESQLSESSSNRQDNENDETSGQ